MAKATETPKKRPEFRISFSPIQGTDDQGNSKLGKPIQIGAAWKRENGKGHILKFEYVPCELAKGECVLFMNPVTQDGGS